MENVLIDRIVLGHNAFFGVDHLSAARGAERAAYFADPARILDVIHAAKTAGCSGMMMSTHERSIAVAELIAADRDLAQGLRIYPLLPYAQKYVTRANEVGLINLVLESLSGSGLMGGLAMMFQGAKGVLARDVNAILGALIRLELKHLEKLKLQAVFLHDVLTDLALGLELPEVFDFYTQEIKRLYGCHGAFATKNLPVLLAKFKTWGLNPPVVMTHVNKAGYFMNPDRAACEAAAAANEVSILAMGTLASGYLKPAEAYAYLATVPKVEAVVVGTSSPGHIAETFAAVRGNMPWGGEQAGA